MIVTQILVKNRVFITEDVERHFNLDVTRDYYVRTQKDIVKSMQEYAKTKCQELLEIVAEKAKTKKTSNSGSWYDASVDKDSIINAVNLNEFIR